MSIEYIMQRIDASGDCWEWTLTPDAYGYGIAHLGGKDIKAHRLVYELLVGPIPDGLVTDHLCLNRICVNPDHVEHVTQSVNAARVKRGKHTKAACPQGHPYQDTGFVNTVGHMACRPCTNASALRHYHNTKEPV